MTAIKHCFDREVVSISLGKILPTSPCSAKIHETQKFKTILSSIRELGLIEPLAVYRKSDEIGEAEYILLDGHLRLEALKLIGLEQAECMIASDDEGFTYNRHTNRLSAIQEHKMILATLQKGASAERIAAVLKIDVKRIKEKLHLLDSIAPEVVTLLKDQMLAPQLFTVLRKMKPMRQIEAAEMMLSAGRMSVSYAQMILVTTRPEQLADNGKVKRRVDIAPEDILRMEREMERLHQDYQAVEDTVGDTMLSLVVAKGYATRVLKNPTINMYLTRHHADLLESLTSTIEAITADGRDLDRG